MNHPHPMLGRYVVPDMPVADELIPYLKTIDANRWYSNFGPVVTTFEERLSAFVARTNLGVALTTMMTCYNALHIGLQLFRLPSAAQVLVPAITFPACPLAVRHAGATPVLADIDSDSWQLTPDIARTVAAKMPIHAVMPVAVYGVPVPVDAWDRFSADTGIPVIIDAAAAFEVQAVPQRGLVAYSLHATKPFCVGEGGLLMSHNAEWIEEARCRSNFGTHNRIALYDGTNAKMSEYHGAIGLAQLDRWEGIKQRRHKVLDYYQSKLAKAKLGLVMQQDVDRAVVSAFMLQSPGTDAAKVTNALNARGVMAHRMYLPPLYHHPHFADLDVVATTGRLIKAGASLDAKRAAMENSELLHQSTFGVPFHAFLDEAAVAYAVQMLGEVLDHKTAKTAHA